MDKERQPHTQRVEVLPVEETDQIEISQDEIEELFAKCPPGKPQRIPEEEAMRQMMLANIAAESANFQQTKEESVAGQHLISALMEERTRQQVSQEELAARMQTKQPALARMEQCNREPKLSTLQKYAAGLGKRIMWQIVDESAVQ